MLTLTYNNQNIPTGLDFSLRLSWINPATRLDHISGDVGLGIDIPVNDYSRAIFGNPQRASKYRSASASKFPGFEIRFSGVLLQRGTFVITSADEEKYSGWLQSDVGVMGEAQKEKFLPDMDWPEDQEFVNKSTYADDVDDYGITTIINYGFWEDKGRETTVAVPYIDDNGLPRSKDETKTVLLDKFAKDFHFQVNFFDESNSLVTEGEACVVSPFLYFRYVVKEVLRKNKWFIDRNDILSTTGYNFSMWRNLMVYNNFNILDVSFELEEVRHDFWDQDSQIWDFTMEQQMVFKTFVMSTFNYKDLLPRVSLKDFLLGIQNSLNMIFHFKQNNRVDIIDRNAILGNEAIDISEYFTGDWILGERMDVALKFVPEYDDSDGRFANEFIDLSDRRSFFKEPVATYQDLLDIEDAQYGDLRLVKQTNKIYQFTWKVLVNEDALLNESHIDALGWEFVSSGPQPYIYRDVDIIEEIKTPLSTLQYNPITFYGIPGFKEVRQKGNMNCLRSLWQDIKFRLINSNEVLNPQALNWEGEYGLFEKRWKRWARFWATRQPAEADFNLPLNVLVYLIDNITSKIRTREGEFIIDEIEVEISVNIIGKTRIKGFKI